MINKIQVNQVANSWSEFAKQYDINEGCTTYLDQLDMLSRMHNGYCYPQLIVPNEMSSKLNRTFIRGMKHTTDKKGIYLQDLISVAKMLSSDYSTIEYISPPSVPDPPIIDEVSETKTIYVNDYHLGCWATILIILLIICIWTTVETGILVIGILYSLSFVPAFLISLHQSDMLRSEKRMKTVRLSNSEIKQKKKDAKEKYEHELQQYRDDKLSYQARFNNYIMTQRANMARIEPILDKILWQFNGKYKTVIQITAERATEVPQRGRSENLLFVQLMEKMPNYVKIDMQVGRYFPDICIIIPGVLAIDIEVDEPYTIGSKSETHYIGCSDEFRNEIFADNGWFVLRFSEEQIITQMDNCVEIIESLVAFVSFGRYESLQRMFHLTQVISKPRWSKEQARLLALKNSREQY